jgi:hypothetical protein
MPYQRQYFIILYSSMFANLLQHNFSLGAEGMGGGEACSVGLFYCEYSKQITVLAFSARLTLLEVTTSL